MYAKLIENELVLATRMLDISGYHVFNPTGEQYRGKGYKPVTFTDEPDAPEGYYYESGWEETAEAIVQTWTLTPLPDDIDEAEAYDIIFGGGE